MSERVDAPGERARGERARGDGVAATWWYTVLSALMFAGAVLAVWSVVALAAPHSTAGSVVLYLLCAVSWVLAVVLLARRAWRLDGTAARTLSAPRVALMAVGVAASIGAGVAAGSVALASSLVVSLVIWQLPRGIRGRLTGVATLLLIAAGAFDHNVHTGVFVEPGWFVPLTFALVLPSAIVSTLWWWEIVRELDLSRATEARLAAARERLRLADDVHDLQGHHLQVIALQLELAERLLFTDPEAALAQLRAAQRSVDDARDGTRSLATRFRGVPLPDELANAVDLLRAAGVDAGLELAVDADAAPRDALGPVVRETTTNILKHGGGRWAKLSLQRSGDSWRFRASNDLAPGGAPPPSADPGTGTGIAGMAGRVAQAGGSVTASAEDGEFVLEAHVPHEEASA